VIGRPSLVSPQPRTNALAALGRDELNASIFKGAAQAGVGSVIRRSTQDEINLLKLRRFAAR
jgi:hypothetical protein